MSEKMKISALICELNPLHKGHASILSHAKKLSEGVVCILSGNFVQRGEPAVLDKWTRTRLALEQGADLVIELPLPFACAGAERFALGGVALAHALHAEYLLFGGEKDLLPLMEKAAEALLSQRFTQLLKEASSQSPGAAFAKRREGAMLSLFDEDFFCGLSAYTKDDLLFLLRSPNCILGLEYCKALHVLASPMRPLLFPRQGAGHDQVAQKGEFCSASEIRSLLFTGQDVTPFVPENTAQALKELKQRGHAPASPPLLERAVLCKLRSLSKEQLASLPDISEGLENRLYQSIRQSGSLSELYVRLKSKRYSHARIRRLVYSAFLGISQNTPPLPPYLRILGMTSQGEALLRQEKPGLPLVGRAGDVKKLSPDAQALFSLESQGDDLYALSFENPLPCGENYRHKLIKLP